LLWFVCDEAGAMVKMQVAPKEIRVALGWLPQAQQHDARGSLGLGGARATCSQGVPHINTKGQVALHLSSLSFCLSIDFVVQQHAIMVNLQSLTVAAAGLLLLPSSQAAGFYTKNSGVLNLDARSYRSLIANSNHTSVSCSYQLKHIMCC
jgi:hypothetical protein